jgi:hypothetical protein
MPLLVRFLVDADVDAGFDVALRRSLPGPLSHHARRTVGTSPSRRAAPMLDQNHLGVHLCDLLDLTCDRCPHRAHITVRAAILLPRIRCGAWRPATVGDSVAD